jgi:pimeloyl-ACP methyl ester carboxylesterase
VRRRREDLDPKDVEGRVGLAKYAIAQKATREASRVLEEALLLAPTNAEALALYGGGERMAAFRRTNLTIARPPFLDEILAARDGKDGAAIARRVFAERAGLLQILPRETLGRVWSSRKEPKGLRRDEKLSVRAEKFSGAVYTVFVPEEYDGWTPLPLLLALHDGGRGGKDGTAVVGSGRDAATLYLEGAQSRRWIVACPTAPVAPWTATTNEALVLAVLDDVCARWNVDLDRVFLVGHGMGADGACLFGPKHTDLFAGIGASAATNPAIAKSVKGSGTAVFLYHAADDPAAPVEATRAAADALLGVDADVVYLELPNLGHSFPTEGQREMVDVFRGKRLNDARRASDWPRASFSRAPTPDEVRAFGDPAARWTGEAGPAPGR